MDPIQQQLLETFSNPLTECFGKHFKDISISIRPTPLGKGIYVGMTLGKGADEYNNRIEHNDPCRIVGTLYTHSKGYEFDFKPSISNLKPTEKFYAMDSEKIKGVRVIRSNEQKVIEGFDKILAKLAGRIRELAEADRFLPLPFNPLDKLV